MIRLLVLVLFVLVASHMRCQVHIVAITSGPVKNLTLEKDGPTIEDGGYFSVSLINTSDKTLYLPSKLPPPDVFVRSDKIDVHFTLALPGGDAYETKSGRHSWVVSRESFFPVELRPGEAMPLDPHLFPLESRKVGPFGAKPIIVHYTTSGKLAARLGFSDVKVSNRAIPEKEYLMMPTSKREP